VELSSTERGRLLGRARLCIAVFMLGLVLSGLTAFPLESELAFVVRVCNHFDFVPAEFGIWMVTVHDAVVDANARYAFMAYGTDWLGFAHLVIAVAFIGAWRDPARNRWVLQFGLIACAMVIPFALIAGGVRGLPFFWRLIDCSFGVVGALVLWPAYRIAGELERGS
jgi:hypothetical protein